MRLKTIVTLFLVYALLVAAIICAADPVSQSIHGKLDSKSGVKSWLINPATSNAPFRTFDNQTTFQSTVICPGAAPILTIQAIPSGVLSGDGELNLVMNYDLDLDGTEESTFAVNHVAGMCSDGLIYGCSPAGSFDNCHYCKWVANQGALSLQCHDSHGFPYTISNLRGCFCFNHACGNPVTGAIEEILSYAGNGALHILQDLNPDMVATDVDMNMQNMTLTFQGAHSASCHQAQGNANQTISRLKNMEDNASLPWQQEVANQPPDSPYSNVETAFQNSGSNAVMRACTIMNDVVFNQECQFTCYSSSMGPGDGSTINNSNPYHPELYQGCHFVKDPQNGCTAMENNPDCTLMDEEIDGVYTVRNGVSTGLSPLPSCRTFQTNVCVHTVEETTNIPWHHDPNYVGRDCDATVDFNNPYTFPPGAHVYVRVNWQACEPWYTRYQIFGVRLEMANCPWAGTIHHWRCWWPRSPEYNGCWITHNCPASIMDPGGSGEIDITPGLNILGRNVIIHAESGNLFSGFTRCWKRYVHRGGSTIQVCNAQITLRIVHDVAERNTISVCEPYWQIHRRYRCTSGNQNYDFSNVKTRTAYIGAHTNYDDNTRTWSSYGDMPYDDESGAFSTTTTNVGFSFQDDSETCHPACQVRKLGKDENIYLPAQQPDNKSKLFGETRDCIKNEQGQYYCPTKPGEAIIQNCTCRDHFAEVATYLTLTRDASKDVTCSSGVVGGNCVDHHEGPEDIQVLCGYYDEQHKQGEYWKCNTESWVRNSALNSQVHEVYADNRYHCRARSTSLSEANDNFQNDLGALSPQNSWFNSCTNWATPRIDNDLKSVPIPSPPSGCNDPFFRGWSISKRNTYNLALNPSSPEPFGNVTVTATLRGSYNGTQYGTCTYHPAGEPEDENPAYYSCSFNSFHYSSEDECKNSCERTVTCRHYTRTYRYRVSIRNTNNDYSCTLRRTSPSSANMGSTTYDSEQFILNQCLSRYTNPFLSMDDQTTGYHFEYSHMDELIYQQAAEWHELPRDPQTHTLPSHPYVYRPTQQVPNIPMFEGKRVSSSWRDDDTVRLGRITLNISNIHPHVYYYMCPQGNRTQSSMNNCGAVDPFGSVVHTINGDYCIQYLCDAQAIDEGGEISSDCGYKDDGQWR